MSFGITGIGYGPYTSPLGMYGLGGGGTFSAYGDPASMGYYSPYGMMGMSGMMGYYPAFMGQMNQVYQNIELDVTLTTTTCGLLFNRRFTEWVPRPRLTIMDRSFLGSRKQPPHHG